MRASLVDPRTTVWQERSPVFRVEFFLAGEAEEWDLSGGDVAEALDWARAHAGEVRTWVLYVHAPGPGLIRLAGVDPNAG